MTRLCGAFAGLLLCAAAAPIPGPTLFATVNYQLQFRVPAGMYHCPYPPEWVGTDHGYEFYITRPGRCDPRMPAATDRQSHRPRITVYYERNIAETVRDGSDWRPPATDAELTAHRCPHPIPQSFTFLGRPAIGCITRAAQAVSLDIEALYSQSPTGEGPPDSIVGVLLVTQPDRYDRDLAMLREVTASVIVCADPARIVPPDLPARGPPCPLHNVW